MASDSISYFGEKLWIGQVGHLMILTTFCFSLLAALGYYLATKKERPDWLKVSNWAFLICSGALFVAIGLFFYSIVNHHVEYFYVYANTSETLPFKYTFSAFWKDQEGSTMLWMFWNAVIGLFIYFRRHHLREGVLSFYSMMQAWMASLLLGIVVGGEKWVRIGLEPFRLLRDEFEAPIFEQADYLSKIGGLGLNPSLQNYWMTIHPPTVFFGYALGSLPIAYAVAALWKGDATSWLKPAYKSALLASAVLGTGIFMGSIWAYEALNFGGYWAWDPVENASLVPWILLVAGLHTNLISLRTGRSTMYTYGFYAFTSFCVLYSTYLTKSGVLGDSSVHSFTEMGLGTQLLMTMFFFLVLFAYQMIRYKPLFPSMPGEEKFWSREFWLFLGTLTLVLSSVLITFTTSIPVWNKILDGVGSLVNQDFSNLHRAIPTEVVDHHNRYQIWIGILVACLSSVALFLRWKETNAIKLLQKVVPRLLASAVIAAIITYLISVGLDLVYGPYLVLAWSSFFAVLTNIDFVFFQGARSWRKFATASSHFGFAIMLLGILISGTQKRHISSNPFVFSELSKDPDDLKNVMLIRDKPLFIEEGFKVNYFKDSLIGNQRHYYFEFERYDSSKNEALKFVAAPSVVYNNEFTKVASVNPDAKKFWNKDIYTHITSLPIEQFDVEKAREVEDSLNYELLRLAPGDSLYTFGYVGVVRQLKPVDSIPGFSLQSGDEAYQLPIKFLQIEGDRSFDAILTMILQNDGFLVNVPYRDNDARLKLKFDDLLANTLYAHEDSLDYESFEVSKGQTFRFKGANYVLEDVVKTTVEDYPDLQTDDLAITAFIRQENGVRLRPTFVVREGNFFPVRDYEHTTRISAKLMKIDPKMETFQLELARNDANLSGGYPILVADNVTRDDFVVLEAIVFPGINLFWFGTTLMMVGLMIGFVLRVRQKVT